jgi:signal transduction histidine kinase
MFDITELRRVKQHAQELDRLLAERSEMLNVLAHEVRQPLNNASAALQSAVAVLAERGEAAASEQMRRAQSVLGAVMSGLDNTLAVASLLAGAGEITLADTDIDLLIGICIADMPAQSRGRIRVERQTPTRTIWADVGLMRLALRNLLANALAFSPPGAPVAISISESDAPLALMIDVTDQGPGIDPSILPRLFERGVRSSPVAHRPSHGLGLYIVRRALALQGGEASLLQTGPAGTTLRLQLIESARAVDL